MFDSYNTGLYISSSLYARAVPAARGFTHPTVMPNSTPSFIENAYDSFRQLLSCCLEYHVQKHRELYGSGEPILAGQQSEFDADSGVLTTRFFVEGKQVAVLTRDATTGQQVIRTTNGDQWYGNNYAGGLSGPSDVGNKGQTEAWSARGAA